MENTTETMRSRCVGAWVLVAAALAGPAQGDLDGFNAPSWLWVDATGAVVGPARSPIDGYHVDLAGRIWDTDRITGEVLPERTQEPYFTGPNCTGPSYIVGSAPLVPLDVGGVVRDVPLGARTVSWTSQSRLFDGVCQPYVQVGCGDWHLCLDLDDVATFDVLMVPPPFAGPLHAEWR